ncbi:MAG: hypothetical protein CMM50_15335 [Rhodospirillaceae bacterium]|jgi:hypothetical protein|nr:hypothetical protein [Rhodospirillaceae bacterium]|tara:strand:+ start:580 stop:768 length:189 start_codon:yes stop_codon:yes gene_type:complete
MRPSSNVTPASVADCHCEDLDTIAPEFRTIVREHCRKCEGEPYDCVVRIMKRIMGESDKEAR